MKLISSIDYIGPKPELYINKKSRFVSFTGGLLSLIIGILSILVFIGFGFNMFARKNPIAFLSKELNEHPTINATEPFFLFGPHLPFGARLNENFHKKFTFKFRYVNSDGVSPERRNNMTYFIDYEMVPCIQTKKFKEDYYNISQNLNLKAEDYYCIPDDISFPIEYKFGSPKFGMYIIFMDFCTKLSKDPSSCYSVEQVTEMYSNVNMHFIYLDSFVDSKDYLNPIKYRYNGDFNLGSTNTQRKDYYFFRNLEFYSDIGWIMESYDIQKTFQFAYTTNDIFSPPTEPLFFYLISVDNIRDVYYRKYLKLQEVLATTGGFVKFCMLFCTFLNNFLTSRTMLESIYLSLVRKYQSKIQLNSYQTINIPIENSNNPINLSKVYINNLEQNANINFNRRISNFNYSFGKPKNEYKELTYLDKICGCTLKFSNPNTLKILKCLNNELKSTLNIDSMLFNKKFHSNQNKLLYGENGSKLFKVVFLMNYLEFKNKHTKKLNNIEEMIKDFDLECNNDIPGNHGFILNNFIKDNLK